MHELSNNTKDFLSKFYNDLDQMIKGMTEVIITDSISHNFILQMIPHHQMAIYMCENLLNYTTNLSLQKMATGIIKEQTKSIQDMENILNSCSELKNSEQDVKLYQIHFHQITDEMFYDMKTACSSNNINEDFLHEMLPHHLGAIKMCKNVRKFEICPQLLPITCSIIQMQETGVEEIRRLLKCV